MWAAPELLGVPTIGGGSARSRGGGGGGHRSQISLPSRPKYMKTAKIWPVSSTFWLINRQKRRFSLKSAQQDILTRRFSRNT
jgi:hypothetical protein